MKPFVAVYGIDGTGKTSTVKSLCTALDNLGQPAIDYNEHKKGISNPTDQIKGKELKAQTADVQLSIYLASLLFHTQEINRLTNEQIVVKDRYIDDVYAHHAHLGASTQLLSYVQSAPIRKPDLRVVLNLPEEIRLERLARRETATSQDMEKAIAGSRLYFMQQYYLRSTDENTLIIDTSQKSLEQVTESIITQLQSTGQI